ncbi:TPA: hypothetical protein EYP26_05025 [Candidatus Bathyarchaeota archaeon]|nr:hypothetical protein [Candidatus Bathyarchaeota archaeon]
MELKESEGGLLLRSYNPVAEMKGLGKGAFGDPIECQKASRGMEGLKLENRLGHEHFHLLS